MKSTLPIILITQNSPTLEHKAQATDITEVGLNLQTELGLELEQSLELELGTSSGKLRLPAIVIWHRGNEYGCQFVGMTPKDSGLLRQWLFPSFEP